MLLAISQSQNNKHLTSPLRYGTYSSKLVRMAEWCLSGAGGGSVQGCRVSPQQKKSPSGDDDGDVYSKVNILNAIKLHA